MAFIVLLRFNTKSCTELGKTWIGVNLKHLGDLTEERERERGRGRDSDVCCQFLPSVLQVSLCFLRCDRGMTRAYSRTGGDW